MLVTVTTTSKGAMERGSQKPWRRSLLDGRAEDALDADAVAAHDGHNLLALGVEDAGAHRFRVAPSRA